MGHFNKRRHGHEHGENLMGQTGEDRIKVRRNEKGRDPLVQTSRKKRRLASPRRQPRRFQSSTLLGLRRRTRIGGMGNSLQPSSYREFRTIMPRQPVATHLPDFSKSWFPRLTRRPNFFSPPNNCHDPSDDEEDGNQKEQKQNENPAWSN